MSKMEDYGYGSGSVERYSVFWPEAFLRVRSAINTGLKFAYYTSAATCLSVINNKKVWLRKALAMNDFLEMEHGINCVCMALNEHGDRYRAVLDEIHPNMGNAVCELFYSSASSFKNNTYILCLSEHAEDEDYVGRLSMWRAYGGDNSVAIVLNQRPFLAPSDALSAYTFPVEYQDEFTFALRFGRYIDHLKNKATYIKSLDPQQALIFLFTYLRAKALSTKHPGFSEEKEWRVIYSPDMDNSGRVEKHIEVISGVPQIVYKIEMKNFPSENFTGAELNEILSRVIVGPSNFPELTREAIVETLKNNQVSDPLSKVFSSDIPLRR